jgi:serine/threonine-protein kinase
MTVPTPPPLSDENMLGPYRLVRKLGEGGMGTVYLGFDEQLARHVAIKVLRLDGDRSAAESALVKRFMREAQSGARLNHPHTVTVYSVGQHAGRPYLVMEYVEGGSLADELRKRGPLPWREAAMAMRDALRGLAGAHRAGVIHRDIKPANLMRADGGAVKLVDFGLARVVYGPTEGEITFPGAFVGSPSYASPEQIAGVARVDGRSDLYSLAATWYALLTGQPPFVDDDPAEIMRLHMTQAFPEVRTLAPDVPDAVIEVMAQASCKDPTERYIGAEEMGAAVERLLTLPASASVAQRVVKPVSSRAGVRPVARAEETVAQLESQLALARRQADSGTQLNALRSLYGLYTQLNRREQAVRAFREAMVVHVKLHEPRMRI